MNCVLYVNKIHRRLINNCITRTPDYFSLVLIAGYKPSKALRCLPYCKAGFSVFQLAIPITK